MESRIKKVVAQGIKEILDQDFFQKIKTETITLPMWQKYLTQKYAAAGYFKKFLKHGARTAYAIGAEEIADEFRQNFLDESGIIEECYRKEYAHETWRVRTLKSFGLTVDQMSRDQIFTTEFHDAIVTALSKNNSLLFKSGALIFNECFVVAEMKALIESFERNLPDMFPQDGYDVNQYPMNTQEYWYSHARHDVKHYKDIVKATCTHLNKSSNQDEDLSFVLAGIEMMKIAKGFFYDAHLVKYMMKV